MTKMAEKGEGVTGAATASDHEGSELTVYFDGSCPLCSLEVGHYAACKGGDKFAFVDVSKADALSGPDLTRDAAMKRFHVRRADGQLLSGAAAFVHVWRNLPGWHWGARLASVPGALLVMEGAYRLFLPVRPFLSKLVARLGARPANPVGEGH